MHKTIATGEEFMVVAFTEPHTARESFHTWPQHMTILSWMRGHRHQATTRIADAVARFGVLRVEITGEGMFGEKDIPAWQPEYEIGDHLTLPELSVVYWHETLGKVIAASMSLEAHETAA